MRLIDYSVCANFWATPHIVTTFTAGMPAGSIEKFALALTAAEGSEVDMEFCVANPAAMLPSTDHLVTAMTSLSDQ